MLLLAVKEQDSVILIIGHSIQQVGRDDATFW